MKTLRIFFIGILFLALASFGAASGGCGSSHGNPDSDNFTDDGGDTSDTEDADGNDPDEPGDDDDDDDNDDNDNDDNGSDYDDDGDGFTEDEGDCDDSDDTIYPGAPDKPDYPDYTDSNCDGIDGDADAALWVAPDGNDTNPGTIELPFATFQKGIDEAKSDLSDIRDVYVVEGVYYQDTVLSEGVGVYGGFGPLDSNNLRTRDINNHLVQYVGATTCFYITQTTSGQESIVEGITFFALPDLPAMMIVNASPRVQHNNIYGVDSPNISYALFIIAYRDDAKTRPVIYKNRIQSANCTERSCASIGVLAGASGDNAIVDPDLHLNHIDSGNAKYVSIGVYVIANSKGEASLTATKNDIYAGTAKDMTVGVLLGYSIWEESNGRFKRAGLFQNQIYGGRQANDTTGVGIVGGTDRSIMTNNFVTGGQYAGMWTGGVYIEESTVEIYNNTINSGDSGDKATAIHIAGGSETRIDNNILLTEASPSEKGIFEESQVSTPASLRNNLFDENLNVKYHDAGVDISNVALVNLLPDIPMIGDNTSGDPAFLDRDNFNYHLAEGSDAIDAGMDNSVFSDIDDDARPQRESWDIGADEFTGVYDDEDGDDDDDNGDDDDDDECGDGCDDWDEDWD